MAPRGTQVGALVFYGRRRYVKLLNMYLERNLATHGGILDEVCCLDCSQELLRLLFSVVP